ncbi:hypothetical protein BGZ63DRAFT_424840 [Mariannaea sp. PMI_226]|nr:hypothetical protein BGZ63DRAFT_424840 [Mariannaea sp. PMI_226]
MRPRLLSFLYQTRTLQRACRCPPSFVSVHQASFATRRSADVDTNPNKSDSSIPFEWDNVEDSKEHQSEVDENQSTITPSEVSIFQSIFEEIAQGRMPRPKRPPPFGQDASSGGSSSSIVDQARDSESGDQFLQRYPQSLRTAAQVALGKFELTPKRPILSGMIGLEEAEARQMAEWRRFNEIQNKEKERVGELMTACRTDLELWQLMEKEVFSLPKKLGIADVAKAKPARKGRKSKKQEVKEDMQIAGGSEATTESAELLAGEGRAMDIHGPLYPHYLATGLNLFDTAFSKLSPLAFNILPHVKSLGLPSYVLGVSTSLFNRLAQIHWNRFGDLVSTVETLEEMREVGLWADEETSNLLQRLRDELHGCAWGAQGQVVMAMTELPPYDKSLDGRIEILENYVSQSFKEQRLDKQSAWDDVIEHEEEDRREKRQHSF